MSTKQRTDEWVNFDDAQLAYHTKQWESPKESTKAFEAFVKDALKSTRSVLDLGAGTAAATAYLAERHPGVNFTAADYVNDYLNIGKAISYRKNIGNLSFRNVDWFDLESTGEFDAVVSLQTLSWLPEVSEPMRQIFEKIKPKWIAITSLFYEGDISCTIEINEHSREKKYFYNIYALPEMERICARYGYAVKDARKFDISIDIEKPANQDIMGTYTRRVFNDGDGSIERLQISGPILMPWHMLLIAR